ncbi:cysteine protease StiP family protein [Lactococcus lactis]|uniref:cysteine protease StiP family protein n=1 Tax=Lactococcus lactis TaxID=1358 RepID=UPI0021A7B781|nr:cysteine protease StiP family protein [Lactococcus lactis]MCT3098668.1 hypothetical protein [Lactococcus lactis]
MTIKLALPLSGPEFGSYSKNDVLWLLKNLSQYNLEGELEEREKDIQSGKRHYSETLPIEYQPDEAYVNLFKNSLRETNVKLARAVAKVAEKIIKIFPEQITLISLARAGVPAGILLKRYINQYYPERDVIHYAISIVRGRGIDENALRFILKERTWQTWAFVDGWSGKGAIQKELKSALKKFFPSIYTSNSFISDLFVLADPGSCTPYYGTREDFLIPSACLNSTVSGLVSRTVLNSLIEANDYHGAKFYKNLKETDVSNYFIDEITKFFKQSQASHTSLPTWEGWEQVTDLAQEFNTTINMIKPGVGETTRVLLRRIPDKILIDPDKRQYTKHIELLAKARGVQVSFRHLTGYSCIGVIKNLRSEVD